MVIHQKNLVILCAQIILGQALQLFALQWVESNIPTTRLENYIFDYCFEIRPGKKHSAFTSNKTV
jgi:hypothetical protein